MAKFQYEHPDLVREGITWTGKPGYIHPAPEPEPIRPAQVAEEPELILPIIPQKDVSFSPIPGWHMVACKNCGKTFWARFGTRKYCSPSCYQDRNNKNSKIRRITKKQETSKPRYCTICSKELPIGLSRSFKTCGDPECRKELNRRTQKAQRERRKERMQ